MAQNCENSPLEPNLKTQGKYMYFLPVASLGKQNKNSTRPNPNNHKQPQLKYDFFAKLIQFNVRVYQQQPRCVQIFQISSLSAPKQATQSLHLPFAQQKPVEAGINKHTLKLALILHMYHVFCGCYNHLLKSSKQCRHKTTVFCEVLKSTLFQRFIQYMKLFQSSVTVIKRKICSDVNFVQFERNLNSAVNLLQCHSAQVQYWFSSLSKIHQSC